MRNPLTGIFLGLLLAVAPCVQADEAQGEADVVAVDVSRTAPGTFRFDVTIASNDTGWDGYADAFEVLSPTGELLGRRVLHHPHVDEQPFTRSLGGVEIGPDVERVKVRAHHSTAGYDGRSRMVPVPH